LDNFLRLHNLDRHLQLYDINGQQQQTATSAAYNNSYITHL